MNKDLLELYSDYLLSSFTHATATGLSRMSAGKVGHDGITRFPASEEMDSRALWRLVKPLARQVESEDGVLSMDDTIEEKPYTDESELVRWHYDHSKGRSVKGVDLVSALHRSSGSSIPVAFELVKKSEWVFDEKKGKWKRKSPLSKNDLYRRMLSACQNNLSRFGCVLSDVWYSSSENMACIKEKLAKEFIMPIKSNRKVALSLEDKRRGLYERVACLELEPNTVREVYLEQV